MTLGLYVAHDANGYYVADNNGFVAWNKTYSTKRAAQEALDKVEAYNSNARGLASQSNTQT